MMRRSRGNGCLSMFLSVYNLSCHINAVVSGVFAFINIICAYLSVEYSVFFIVQLIGRAGRGRNPLKGYILIDVHGLQSCSDEVLVHV